MVLRVVGLPALFRPSTSHVYPPFKQGRYMEEYIYDALVTQERSQEIDTDLIYIPIFWTNLQNHPGFSSQQGKYQMLLDRALLAYPRGSHFFTCVQHDDGPGLSLPVGCRVYGACTGNIPLPLIYEDTEERLLSADRKGFQERDILLSFVGTVGTHPLREAARRALEGRAGVMFSSRETWSVSVPEEDAKRFVEWTGRSRFCLAPRGYGRSSFRFFEAMLLDVVPVYVWDDVEWLPYRNRCDDKQSGDKQSGDKQSGDKQSGDKQSGDKQSDNIDYKRFCVSIHVSELSDLYDRLERIREEEYLEMLEEMRRVRPWFRLEGMMEWLVQDILS